MSAIALWWRGTGWWSYPFVALVTVAVALFFIYEPGSAAWVSHGERAFAGAMVRLESQGPVRTADALNVRLKASRELALQLALGDTLGGVVQSAVIGSSDWTEVSLPVPPKTGVLQLTLRARSEQTTWVVGHTLKTHAP